MKKAAEGQKGQKLNQNHLAGYVVTKYLVFGMLWIIFSDKILAYLVPDFNWYALFQTAKGWVYIFLTAGFLYGWTKKELQKVIYWQQKSDQSEAELKRLNTELEEKIELRSKELIDRNKALESALEREQDGLEALRQSHQELEEIIANYEKMKSIIIRTERMAALGELMGGITHEISTPLGIALTANTFSEAKLKELEDKLSQSTILKNELYEGLTEIGEGIELNRSNLVRLRDLVSSVKHISVDKIQFDKRVIEWKSYLEELVFSLIPVLKMGHHKVTIKAEQSIMSETYPGAVGQIFTNLIVNAVLHGFENKVGGEISIDIEEKDGFISILFKDDGIGIGPEDLERIFDPFFTTKQDSGGTGLGLSIVYHLVTDKLGGEIFCESELGKGTAFKLTLPLEVNEKGLN